MPGKFRFLEDIGDDLGCGQNYFTSFRIRFVTNAHGHECGSTSVFHRVTMNATIVSRDRIAAAVGIPYDYANRYDRTKRAWQTHIVVTTVLRNLYAGRDFDSRGF